MIQNVEYKEALEILEEIEENVNVCCAVTMEPDEVLDLIDKDYEADIEREKWLNSIASIK